MCEGHGLDHNVIIAPLWEKLLRDPAVILDIGNFVRNVNRKAETENPLYHHFAKIIQDNHGRSLVDTIGKYHDMAEQLPSPKTRGIVVLMPAYQKEHAGKLPHCTDGLLEAKDSQGVLSFRGRTFAKFPVDNCSAGPPL